MNEDLDEVQKKIDEKKQGQEITGQERANAIVNLAKQPENMVRLAVSDKITQKVNEDKNTIARIDKTADKLVESGVTVIENEAESSENESETGKLETYFKQHKEELKTAGIDKYTYKEDMERGVKWHRRWSDVHWILFGWWLTGIRTFCMKAKPFKIILNIIALLGLTVFLGGVIWGTIKLVNLIL